MIKNNKKILLATGGTGGHIFPALSLKKSLDEKGFKTLVTADAKFAKYHSFDQNHILIPSANFANKSPLKILASFLTLSLGFLKAILVMIRYNPDVVIGFGGYASYSMMLAAIIFRKKIILHEANTVIGKVNRMLLKRAEYLTTGFKKMHNINPEYKDKIVYTGNPIRQEILLSAVKNKEKIKGLSILIIGGSQGAKIFSKIIPDVIVNLPKEIKNKLHVIHQVKEEDVELIKSKYARENISYEIRSFFNNMNEKLSQVNLVIARAGASTISELIAFEIPGIFIPYPSAADNHQYYNAKEIEEINAGWIVNESAASATEILQIIKAIDKRPLILENATKALKKLKKDAASNIISLIEKI